MAATSNLAATAEFVRHARLEGGFDLPVEELPADVDSPIRLCRKDMRITVSRMNAILRRLGITTKQYYTWTGNQTPAAFIECNATWSLRAWEVLVIENLEMLKRA